MFVFLSKLNNCFRSFDYSKFMLTNIVKCYGCTKALECSLFVSHSVSAENKSEGVFILVKMLL